MYNNIIDITRDVIFDFLAGRDEIEIPTPQTDGRRDDRQPVLQSRGLFVELESQRTRKRSDQGNAAED